MRMESPWSFCPHCGTASTHESQESAAPLEHEQPPVKGAFSGLFLGVIVAPVLIIVGAMLCLTGLGAFVGVPMIIVGALSPLLGPMLGISAVRGKCPWCDAKVSSIGPIGEFACHACSGKITVRNHREIVKAS
jgi:DNA-directed RNA polymerase subunit RPC12/RpoP